MTTTIEHLDRVVEVTRELNQWDEFPMLYVLTGDTKSIVVLGMDEPLPDVLPRLSAQVRAGTFAVWPKGETVTGVILVWEGWALLQPPEGSVRAREIAEFLALGGRIEVLDERIEVKIFFAVDAEGLYSREYHREGEVTNIAADGGHHEGRLVDGIRDLFEALSS